MPRPSKPWWRDERQAWFVKINGTCHNLGENRAGAFKRFYELKAKPEQQAIKSEHVAALCDTFLDFCFKHRSQTTYEWYLDRLQRFKDRYPQLRTADLRPLHLQTWIDSMEVSSGTKRNYCRAIQRVMRWAEEQGYIDRSPIAHFKKPAAGMRDVVISAEEFERILKNIPRQPFRDLVTFAWETGARASECLALEKRHVDGSRIVFPVAEEKMKRIPRVIYMTEVAEGIVRRLMLKYPEGPLFRTTDGNGWETDAVNCAFIRLEKKIGHKYCLTHFRHSWCHRMLLSGVDALTVSMLMGHAGPSTVARVYSHLSHAPEYLLKTVRAKGTA